MGRHRCRYGRKDVSNVCVIKFKISKLKLKYRKSPYIKRVSKPYNIEMNNCRIILWAVFTSAVWDLIHQNIHLLNESLYRFIIFMIIVLLIIPDYLDYTITIKKTHHIRVITVNGMILFST
jgi:hypothetical protein